MYCMNYNLTVFNFRCFYYEIDNVYLKNPKIMTRSKFDECFEKMITEDIVKSHQMTIQLIDYLSQLKKNVTTSTSTKWCDGDTGDEPLKILSLNSETYLQ